MSESEPNRDAFGPMQARVQDGTSSNSPTFIHSGSMSNKFHAGVDALAPPEDAEKRIAMLVEQLFGRWSMAPVVTAIQGCGEWRSLGGGEDQRWPAAAMLRTRAARDWRMH